MTTIQEATGRKDGQKMGSPKTLAKMLRKKRSEIFWLKMRSLLNSYIFMLSVKQTYIRLGKLIFQKEGFISG